MTTMAAKNQWVRKEVPLQQKKKCQQRTQWVKETRGEKKVAGKESEIEEKRYGESKRELECDRKNGGELNVEEEDCVAGRMSGNVVVPPVYIFNIFLLTIN